MNVIKNKDGKTSIDITDDVVLHYVPGTSTYILEDFRGSDAVYTTILTEEILDILYNKAWENKEK